MGIDGADVNGDGRFDYYLTNFLQETDVLYLSEEGGFYEDATGRAGLAEPTYLPLAFGTGFIDFDLDGDLDVFVACGHILDNVEELYPGKELKYAQTPQLFENLGDARFRDVSRSSGACFLARHVSRATARPSLGGIAGRRARRGTGRSRTASSSGAERARSPI